MLDQGYIIVFAISAVVAFGSAWWIRDRMWSRWCDRLDGRGEDAVRGPNALACVQRRWAEDLETIRREQAMARHITEERVRQSRRILDALEDPVVVIDREGLVLESNGTADTLAHCTGDQGTHRLRLGDVVHNPVAIREILELARGLTDDSNGLRRVNFSSVDDQQGPVRDFEVSLRRLDDTGRILLVLHDTTREREIARMKSEFVAKASHELRTPLSSIRATLEMLESGDLEDPEHRTEMMAIASEESERLARMVDDMLDISRIEAGVARPRIERVDLGSLVGEALDGLRAVADRRSIDLRVMIADGGLEVEGDRGMLNTVVVNLVGNALKYVPEGERVTVEVAPEDLTRSVVVTVTDTGLGIPEEDLPRIFEKFYRVSRYERRAQGTGLGLDLCRNIVERVHQGRIGVDSRIGEGARFWFGVPASYASLMAA